MHVFFFFKISDILRPNYLIKPLEMEIYIFFVVYKEPPYNFMATVSRTDMNWWLDDTIGN